MGGAGAGSECHWLRGAPCLPLSTPIGRRDLRRGLGCLQRSLPQRRAEVQVDCTSLPGGTMSRSLDAARSFLEQLEALDGRDEVVFAGEFSVSGRVWTAELLLLAVDSSDLCLFCAPCCTLLLSRRPGSSSHFEISLFFSPQHLSVALSLCLPVFTLCLQSPRGRSPLPARTGPHTPSGPCALAALPVSSGC